MWVGVHVCMCAASYHNNPYGLDLTFPCLWGETEAQAWNAFHRVACRWPPATPVLSPKALSLNAATWILAAVQLGPPGHRDVGTRIWQRTCQRRRNQIICLGGSFCPSLPLGCCHNPSAPSSLDFHLWVFLHTYTQDFLASFRRNKQKFRCRTLSYMNVMKWTHNILWCW